MIDTNITLNTMINSFPKEQYVTASNCLEFANSYLKASKIQSLIIVLLFILVVILYIKLEKEKKGRQAPCLE